MFTGGLVKTKRFISWLHYEITLKSETFKKNFPTKFNFEPTDLHRKKSLPCTVESNACDVYIILWW